MADTVEQLRNQLAVACLFIRDMCEILEIDQETFLVRMEPDEDGNNKLTYVAGTAKTILDTSKELLRTTEQ